MAARQEHTNEYFNGLSFMVFSALALVMATVMAVFLGVQPQLTDGHGIFFKLNEPLIADGILSATVNVACLLLTGGILLAINKVFTFVRSMTRLFVSAFFLLQLANPSGLVTFNVGTLLCVVTALTLMPLFASYQDKHSQRSIFLIFALVVAGTMFHYGFILLIPAYLLGFLNMRSMGPKGVLAMLFGLVTPFWIMMGLGLVSLADFSSPRFDGIWTVTQVNKLVVLAAATAVLGMVLAVMNLYTIINYRLQTRVYNLFFIIVMLLTLVALCLDWKNLTVYLPLLNLTVAVQVAQVHTLRTSAYRYIFILLFTIACIASCVTNLMLS